MNTDFSLSLSETSSLSLLDPERVKMAEMGRALRQDFQALMDQHARGWFESEHGLEESRQVLSTLAAEIQNLLQISNDLISLQRWLTSGFAPIAPTPLREFESNPPQAWETSALVPEVHLSVVQPSQQSEQSSTTVKQGIARDISQPDGLASSPLFQKQPGSIGGLRDLAQFLTAEEQEAIEEVENSQDSIRAAINPITSNSPPSILLDDLPVDPEASSVIWQLEADKLPQQNLTSEAMDGSTELQALVKLAESENLQLPNHVSGDDTRDLTECEFVQNDSDLGLPGGCPLNSPTLGYDVSAQPTVNFESNPPQAWETSVLVSPKFGELGGQVPSKPQRIGESTFSEQSTPRLASPEVHLSVVQLSQQSEQSSTTVKQGIARDISQPDGLASSPLFQKQPGSIGGLRDLAQFLTAEEQEAIEEVENSQDSIRAAINPITSNSPPSILLDDLPVDPEASSVIWQLEADKLPQQNLTSEAMDGSTELQALVKLAESENLQLPNHVSGLERSASQAYQYPSDITTLVDTNEMSLETFRLNNHLEPGNVNQSLQHQLARHRHREIPKILSIREQNSWVEEPAYLSRMLSEEDLDVIVDAIAKEIQQQYRQFYGS